MMHSYSVNYYIYYVNVLLKGFLLDFISLPVITGFTSAAAINIASSQFKSLLGIPGRSENFLEAVIGIFKNLQLFRYQDTLLGFGTIIVLVLLKVYHKILSDSQDLALHLTISVKRCHWKFRFTRCNRLLRINNAIIAFTLVINVVYSCLKSIWYNLLQNAVLLQLKV